MFLYSFSIDGLIYGNSEKKMKSTVSPDLAMLSLHFPSIYLSVHRPTHLGTYLHVFLSTLADSFIFLMVPKAGVTFLWFLHLLVMVDIKYYFTFVSGE